MIFFSPFSIGHLSHEDYQELVPQFCSSYRDRALADDVRVFRNMLRLEPHYSASLSTSYESPAQHEIRPHMRKIVAEWMLDVCVDQRCHSDVFLLACSIMDRFLATIALRKQQFQLLGAASIFLASKLVESSPVPAVTLVRYTADTYDREELLVSKLNKNSLSILRIYFRFDFDMKYSLAFVKQTKSSVWPIARIIAESPQRLCLEVPIPLKTKFQRI